MLKKNSKSKVYEEYFVNDNHLKKLYHMYIHKSIWDKILDILVLFGIIFTIMGIILEILLDINDVILHLIHQISFIVLFIFILELLRDYVHSKTTRIFFKKHWVDVLLVTILSLFFLFSTFFGITRLKFLTSFKGYAQDMKQFRVLFKIFKR